MRMNAYTGKAIKNLAPNATWTIEDGVFTEFSGGEQPSEAAIEVEIDRLLALAPFEDCVAEAKQRIAATDWAVLPDVNIQNQAEFVEYRAALRALILNPVVDPVWPSEPQPVWQ